MYDSDGHFDPMDDYFTEDEFYPVDPNAEERDRWPTADQDPALEQRPAPIQKPEKNHMAQAAPAPSSIGREAQTAHALKTPEELANIWADAFKELRTQLPEAPPEILGPAATSILINLTGGKRF